MAFTGTAPTDITIAIPFLPLLGAGFLRAAIYFLPKNLVADLTPKLAATITPSVY